MIRFMLRCDQSHEFESWFKSTEAFDALRNGGRLACAICGSSNVEKALMAPAVVAPRGKPAKSPDLQSPSGDLETALAAMRRHVEENSEYVGMNFAAEARAIHQGDAPERSIYGEARGDEAKRLIEDGVPVAPLPFLPTRRAN